MDSGSGTFWSEVEGGGRERVRRALKMSLGLALAALFLWLAFRRIALGEFLGALEDVRLLPVFQAVALLLGAHAARAWRWKLLLSESHPGLRPRHAFAALMVGYALNAALPRAGELGRTVFLRAVSGTPISAGLSSVFVDRLMDLACLALLFAVAVGLFQDRLERLFPGLGLAVLVTLAVAALGLLLVWALSRNPSRAAGLIRSAARRIRPSREEGVSEMGENFLRGLAGLFKREQAVALVGLSAGIWALYILANWALFFALPFGEGQGMGLGAALALSLVTAVAILVPSPGGAGTIHFFAGRTLIGLFSVPPAEALVYATMVHAIGVLPALLLGGTYAVVLGAADKRAA